MTEARVETIDRPALAQKIDDPGVDNDDPRQGFALVNVLGLKDFEREHIPGSINIPLGKEDGFEALFDKEKEIILYCASAECDASPKAARELIRRGFQRVRDYEAGMSDWKQAGCEVSAGPPE